MMNAFQNRYRRALPKLLEDPTICPENREVFKKFFEWEEYKLQRQNDLRELDEACYKTLYVYIGRLRIVNRWFGSKPWTDLSREDVQKVYDDVEDGRLLTLKGKPFKSADTYYNRILKGKPFQVAGTAHLAHEVIQFRKKYARIVCFVTLEGFLNLVSVLNKPRHLLLSWLAWDVGENINALLQLQKRDFTRAVDPQTGEPEYRVHLPSIKLKRTRQTRTEPTLYPETVRYADIVLKPLADDDLVFPFGYRQALKVLHGAAQRAGVTCMPDGGSVRWKDLRSGMACRLLEIGWQPHEINLRLGHTPNATTLNAYINYLAVNRRKPAVRTKGSEIKGLREELQNARARERLTRSRHEADASASAFLHDENRLLRQELMNLHGRVAELAHAVAAAKGP